jgi:hypothetical protein
MIPYSYSATCLCKKFKIGGIKWPICAAGWSLRELDDNNCQDRETKEKICKHCESSKTVSITRTANNDLGIIPLTKDALLEAVRAHILARWRVHSDTMDNGDTAYIILQCTVEEVSLYVKVRFFEKEDGEAMLVISAHPPRRWS